MTDRLTLRSKPGDEVFWDEYGGRYYVPDDIDDPARFIRHYGQLVSWQGTMAMVKHENGVTSGVFLGSVR